MYLHVFLVIFFFETVHMINQNYLILSNVQLIAFKYMKLLLKHIYGCNYTQVYVLYM